MRDWESEVRRRLQDLRIPPARESEIVEELSQHLEDRYQELVSRGSSVTDARALVLGELAGDQGFIDAMRSLDRAPDPDRPVLGAPTAGGALRGLWRDAAFAIRSIRKSPGFAAITLLTLGLSIGATVTIFSVVNAVLLRPLPFANADRIVAFWGSAPEKGLPVVRYPQGLYAWFRARSRTLDPLAASRGASFTLTGRGDPERLRGTNVSVEFFPLIGATPLHRRTFVAGEDTRGKNLVTILSHRVWQERFDGNPTVVGQPITLNGIPTVVVGIMRPDFDFPDRTELWIPIGIDPQDLDCWCYSTFGRLAPGATPDDAAREIAGLSDQFFQERDPNAVHTARSVAVAKPLARELTGDIRTPLLVLFGAVGMVLLIACANLANLLLARGAARSREIALRCCLGATRPRIIRQLLIESLLLSAAGAGVGLALSTVGVRALGTVAMQRVTYLHEVTIDPTVLLFAIGVAVAAGLLFGVIPALRSTRVDLATTLKDGGRSSRGVASRRLYHGFVVAQIALSAMLLVGAVLLLRSFDKLLQVDPGFRAENTLVGRISLPYRAYAEPERARDLFSRLTERLRALPAVREVGLAETAPFSSGGNQQEFVIQGQEPGPNEPTPVASVRAVTPTYFAAIGTALLRGRAFSEADIEGTPRAAIIDETLAKRYWPDGDALGKHVRTGGAPSPWRTIVGVAQAVKHADLAEHPEHYVYVPLAQEPRWTMDLIVRTVGDPNELTTALRQEIRALDPELPVYQVHALEQAIGDSLRTRQLTNVLLAAFAAAAVLLAAIGTFGVMALEVTSRTPEFGIRLALGARPSEVLRLVLGQGMRLIVAGIAVGLAGAAALARIVRSLLFGVEPTDAFTFALVALLLATVALLACYLPARRATATDPLEALRVE